MSGEFNKLDQLMKRNTPSVPKQSSVISFPKKVNWPAFVVSLGMTCLVCIIVVKQYPVAPTPVSDYSEILTWDITADETPEEFEVTLAVLDL